MWQMFFDQMRRRFNAEELSALPALLDNAKQFANWSDIQLAHTNMLYVLKGHSNAEMTTI